MPDACQVSPLSFSRVILILIYICTYMLCARIYVGLCACVCISRPLRERTRGNSSYFRSAHISLFVCHRTHRISPPFPSSTRRISRLQQHPRPLSNSAPCAYVRLLLSLLSSSAQRLVPPPDMSPVLLPGFSVRESDNIPTIQDIRHRGISLQLVFPEFSGNAVESNTLVSEYNASHVISRGVT